MIQIRIGKEQRDFNSLDESWIIDQVMNRRNAGEATCVQVYIDHGNIRMILSTPGCDSAAKGKSRPFSELEKPIAELWEKRGLKEPDFSPCNLISFLKQIREYA
jgi:hypothetical protein